MHDKEARNEREMNVLPSYLGIFYINFGLLRDITRWFEATVARRRMQTNTSLNRKIAEMPVSWISAMIFVSPSMLMSPEKPNEYLDDGTIVFKSLEARTWS